MEFQKTIVLGFSVFKNLHSILPPNANYGERLKFLSGKGNPPGRLLLAFMQFLQQHGKYFDRINIVLNYEQNGIWANGTLRGILKKINHSEIDVGVKPHCMNERSAAAVDFAYPYELDDFTFVTRKPEYRPHVFGIFQMFSLPVWLTIISVLIAMPIVCYAILKRRNTFDKISVGVFAILMKQSASIKLSSAAEKLLVYSWVVGAMLLCLSYDSVFLSFLSIPPVTKIKDLSDLALAIERGDYHCIAYPLWGHVLKNDDRAYLRIIGTEIVKNKLSYGEPLYNFLRQCEKQNLAFIVDTRFIDVLPSQKFFASEDHFNQEMKGAMVVRKDFCCKDLLNSFVHKIMASGLYMKYLADAVFVSSMEVRRLFPDFGTTNRKLTLTDIAPAFIFLLTGYFISFVALIVEIVLGRKEMNSIKIKRKRKQRQKRGYVSDTVPV